MPTLANLIVLLTVHFASTLFSRPIPPSSWSRAQNFAQTATQLSSQATPASMFYQDKDLLKYYNSFKDLPSTLKRAGVPSGFEILLPEVLFSRPKLLTKVYSLVAQARSLAFIGLIFPTFIILSVVASLFVLFTNVFLSLFVVFTAVMMSGWVYSRSCPTMEDVFVALEQQDSTLYDRAGPRLWMSALSTGVWFVFLAVVTILGGG